MAGNASPVTSCGAIQTPKRPLTPPGAVTPPARRRKPTANILRGKTAGQERNALVKTIARAFRRREMIENGTYATIAELAATEKINSSYVARMMRLTLLAPDIVEAILNGRQPPAITLAILMRPFAVEWQQQQADLCKSECLRIRSSCASGDAYNK
jgi:hypothetical protein